MKRYQIWLKLAACAAALTTLSACDDHNWNGGYYPPPGPTTTDGVGPDAMIQGTDGNFYGTTAQGGLGPCSQGCGTIFKLTPTGLLTTLYSFTGGADGGVPNAVIQ